MIAGHELSVGHDSGRQTHLARHNSAYEERGALLSSTRVGWYSLNVIICAAHDVTLVGAIRSAVTPRLLGSCQIGSANPIVE